jgi:hypothetical protein
MPNINEKNSQSSDNNSNFYAFDMSIIIRSKKNAEMAARNILREYISSYIPNRIYDQRFPFNIELSLLTGFFSDQIKYYGDQENIKIYPVDFLEGSGSLLVTMKLIVECFIAYDHLYEALERVARKLEGALSNNDFDVTVRQPTPRSSHSHPQPNPKKSAGASAVRFLRDNLIGSIALVCVFVIWFGSRKEEEKPLFPEKIDVLIRQQAIPPPIDTTHLQGNHR